MKKTRECSYCWEGADRMVLSGSRAACQLWLF